MEVRRETSGRPDEILRIERRLDGDDLTVVSLSRISSAAQSFTGHRDPAFIAQSADPISASSFPG
jgi:hypothetical protein